LILDTGLVVYPVCVLPSINTGPVIVGSADAGEIT